MISSDQMVKRAKAVIEALDDLGRDDKITVLYHALAVVIDPFAEERHRFLIGLADQAMRTEAEASVALSRDPNCQTHSYAPCGGCGKIIEGVVDDADLHFHKECMPKTRPA